MAYIRIKNWEHFQHYKDRNPPWIKLHRELLSSRTWVMVDDASKALAVALMMIAAGNDNKIPADPAYIQRVAYLESTPDLQKLVETDFIEFIEENNTHLADASACKQVLAEFRPETETETETEKKKTSRKAITFSAWMKTISQDQDAIPQDHHVFRYAQKVKLPESLIDLAWCWFEKTYTANRKRYVDWPAVFRKAVESNWGKIWWITPEGDYQLTTTGVQLQREMKLEAN